MKIKGVWVLLSLLVALALTLATPMAFAGDYDAVRMKRLTSQIDYRFVGHLNQTDDEGRRLIWEATIEGDLNGTMKWWFGPSPAPPQGYLGGGVSYYAARWEIWDSQGQKLLLAGDSAGKTVFPAGADGMWDGHGVVTQARKGFNPLKRRHIYETGPVSGAFPDLYGTGIFVIY
jgi:hypothetical protein